MNEFKTISAEDIEEALQTRLSDKLKERCTSAALRYEEISAEERDNYIREVIEVLMKVYEDTDIKPAGEHRLTEWERGWGENLDAIKKGKSVNRIQCHKKEWILPPSILLPSDLLQLKR